MRRLVAVTAVVVALAAGWSTAAQVVAQTDGLDGDPEIQVAYYDVPGRDARTIREGMNRLGPTDAADGERVHAVTRWNYKWRWRRQGGPQGCATTSPEVSLRIEVLLPRPAELDQLNPRVRAQWDAYIVALRRHEFGHVRIARAGRDEIMRSLEGASCDDAAALAQAASDKVKAASALYDRQTRHGRDIGASF